MDGGGVPWTGGAAGWLAGCYSFLVQITVEIPETVAAQMLDGGVDPSRAVLEAVALEGYRSHRLSEAEVQQMLRLETRMQVHSFLKEHGAYLHYSADDFQDDIETIRRVRAAEAVREPSHAG